MFANGSAVGLLNLVPIENSGFSPGQCSQNSWTPLILPGPVADLGVRTKMMENWRLFQQQPGTVGCSRYQVKQQCVRELVIEFQLTSGGHGFSLGFLALFRLVHL